VLKKGGLQRAAVWLLLSSPAACSNTAGIRPIASPDPATPCPAGRVNWNLQITDQRADLSNSQRVTALIQESLSRSLPACRWTGSAQDGAGTIRIDVHRFATAFDGGVWDAAAEWGIWVRAAAGQTLTEFEATGEASRPNYRGENSERVALQQALEQAMAKTLAGLRSLSLPSEKVSPQ
jgi:hypothetical protein